MTAYETIQFEPPAPIAHVTLRNPNTGVEWSDVPMLLDTGSDVTLIPTEVLSLLGISTIPDIEYEMLAFDGGPSRSAVVQLDLIFCRRTFHGQYLLINEPHSIIGRNVLNMVPILLDGPNLRWDEYRPTR